jgi:hypothetical protein
LEKILPKGRAPVNWAKVRCVSKVEMSPLTAELKCPL